PPGADVDGGAAAAPGRGGGDRAGRERAGEPRDVQHAAGAPGPDPARRGPGAAVPQAAERPQVGPHLQPAVTGKRGQRKEAVKVRGEKRRVTRGEFGPVSGPVTAAGVSLATAGWGDVLGLSPWWAAAAAGACGVLTLATAVRQGLPAFARIHQVGCWIAYGAWTCWAMPGGPWD